MTESVAYDVIARLAIFIVCISVMGLGLRLMLKGWRDINATEIIPWPKRDRDRRPRSPRG